MHKTGILNSELRLIQSFMCVIRTFNNNHAQLQENHAFFSMTLIRVTCLLSPKAMLNNAQH